uniref:DNA polymerase I isoform X3 n=1 Tax=Rhizophora mucronata TaxID=61149 RepID=A0A2P2J9R6_RHIMU
MTLPSSFQLRIREKYRLNRKQEAPKRVGNLMGLLVKQLVGSGWQEVKLVEVIGTRAQPKKGYSSWMLIRFVMMEASQVCTVLATGFLCFSPESAFLTLLLLFLMGKVQASIADGCYLLIRHIG